MGVAALCDLACHVSLRYGRLTGSKRPGLPAGWQAEAYPTLGIGFS
jgi:hypothetical protein